MNDRAPDVSVLIVNWNTRDLLERCLNTLPAGMGKDFEYETIVVDNASVDGSVELLRSREDVELLENRENLGFAAAVNQAYRRSRAPLVLLLNSDVELLPDSVAVLAELLLFRQELAGAAPVYRNPDGSSQQFHFRFPTFGVTLANASAMLRKLPRIDARLRAYRMLDDDFSQPRSVPQPSASCLLLRRSSLPSDDVFDERYPIFFNDVQLARSLRRAGYELWVTPDAVVVHEGHASTRQLGGSLKRQYIASVVRFLKDTEPRRNVVAYQALMLVQGLVLIALRRASSLPWRDLTAAIWGDPGPLPSEPHATAGTRVQTD